MQQLALFGLSCALVSVGTGLAFVASLVGERARRPSAIAAGVFTVLGVVALFGGAMTT